MAISFLSFSSRQQSLRTPSTGVNFDGVKFRCDEPEHGRPSGTHAHDYTHMTTGTTARKGPPFSMIFMEAHSTRMNLLQPELSENEHKLHIARRTNGNISYIVAVPRTPDRFFSMGLWCAYRASCTEHGGRPTFNFDVMPILLPERLRDHPKTRLRLGH